MLLDWHDVGSDLYDWAKKDGCYPVRKSGEFPFEKFEIMISDEDLERLYDYLTAMGEDQHVEGRYEETALEARYSGGPGSMGDEMSDEDYEPDPGDMDGDAESALASAGWGTDEDYGYYGGEE